MLPSPAEPYSIGAAAAVGEVPQVTAAFKGAYYLAAKVSVEVGRSVGQSVGRLLVSC